MGTRCLSTTFLHANSKNGKWRPRTSRFQEAASGGIISKGYPATSRLSVHMSFSRKIPLGESSPVASGTRVCQVCGHCGQSLLWGRPCSSLLTNWSDSSQNIRRLSGIGPGPGSPVAWIMKALERVAAWPPTLVWPWACHFCDTGYSAIKWDNNASSIAHTISSKASYFSEGVFLWPVFSPCPLCFHHADPFNVHEQDSLLDFSRFL